MKLLRSTTLLLLPLVFGAPAAAQVPTFDSDWIGYDTGQADVIRWPWQMRAGDLDGDGDLDYAVANGASIPGVSILRNDGHGGFGEPPLVLDTPGTFWEDAVDVELVDLDGDQDLDVVTAIYGNAGLGNQVTVHRNLGGGQFSAYVAYPTGVGPAGLAAGDLDGDGNADVVSASHGYIGQGSTISILRGNGAGALLPPVHVEVGPEPRRVRAADLDLDGDLDLGVALQDETLVVLLNQGGLAFSKRSYPVLASPYAGTEHAAVEFGDLDLDGDLDAVYTSTKCGFDGGLAGDGAVGVLWNRGDGTFELPLELPTLPETQGGAELALADWNGDGRLDVASAHFFEGVWQLFESDGSGGFLPARGFAAGSTSTAIDGSDVTGDGRADVVVLGRNSNELCVYRSTGEGGAALEKNPKWPFVTTIVGIYDPIVADGFDAADVDGDGDLDLGTAWFQIQLLGGGQAILRNDGSGAFPQADVYQTAVGAANFDFAEVNGDGWVDVLSTDATQGGLRRRLNLGGGTFGPEVAFPLVSSTSLDPSDLEAFDVDHDGDADVVVAWSQNLVVKRNEGGSFDAPALVHQLTTFVDLLAHGDLDGDGSVDVVTNSSFIGVDASLGNGDGTFQAPIQSLADWAVKGIALADLDEDGFLDAATHAWSDDEHDHPTVQVLLGWGDGSFKLPKTYLGSHEQGTASNGGPIVAADFDQDGDLDLATGNYWSQDVSTFLNRGDGTFDPQVRYGVGASVTTGTLAGDFDGDGVPDVAVGVTIGPSIDFFPAAVVLPSTGGGAWIEVGAGLAGVSGVPRLEGTPLLGGEPLALALTSAAPSAPGAIVVGFAPAPVPLFGGTFVPSPDVVVPLVTDGAGAATAAGTWPPALPPGTTVYAQAGVLDLAAERAVALSTAIAGTQL